MIKDTNKRFPNNKNWGNGWGWALFKTGNHNINVSMDYKNDCLGCHFPAKNNDWVYTEGYPTLTKPWWKSSMPIPFFRSKWYEQPRAIRFCYKPFAHHPARNPYRQSGLAQVFVGLSPALLNTGTGPTPTPFLQAGMFRVLKLFALRLSPSAPHWHLSWFSFEFPLDKFPLDTHFNKQVNKSVIFSYQRELRGET